MSTFSDLEAAAPELAAFVRERFEAHRHKTMATLRAGGAPRISGVEVTFHGGEAWIGGMPGARKSADLLRDPRVAIHSGSDDPPDFRGDARLAGRAVPVEDPAAKADFMVAAGGGPPGSVDLFRLDIREVSTVRIGAPADHLVIELWRPGEPVRRFERG